MGGMILPQEILEHVLQYVDGDTLLMCTEVSPQFAAAVKFLGEKRNIWKKFHSKEKEGRCFYGIVSKMHPHNEGLNHPKHWGLLYEARLLGNFICNKEPSVVGELKIGKNYSDIEDAETHEDLILLLVKYNKDFSFFYKILTVDLQNNVIHKSCKFNAKMVYVTPIEDPSNTRTDTITLSCDLCQLVAVPVHYDETVVGFPKFSRSDDFLKIEHSNGEVLWISNFGKLLTKANCFHAGTDLNPEELKRKVMDSVKITHGFHDVRMSWGETCREFNGFEETGAFITATLFYSNLLFVGTDIGMLYVYQLKDESDLQLLNLRCYIQHYDVCSDPILIINVMELKNQFVIVCYSEKSLYWFHINRQLWTFT